MKKIHKKVMALLLAALMITSVMDTHVQAESSTEANNISVVNDGTGDAEEVSDVEKKDMEENKDETEKKEESDVEEAGRKAAEEAVKGSADDEEKKDVDTYKSKNEVVEQASKKAPTEVKSCSNSGVFSDILNFEFADSTWMNAITAVSVNGDTSYTKGSINSFGASGKLWNIGNATGAYGSYTALQITGFSSSDYPLTVKIKASGYEDVTMKVVKTTVSYQDIYTATIESSGSGENPDPVVPSEEKDAPVDFKVSSNFGYDFIFEFGTSIAKEWLAAITGVTVDETAWTQGSSSYSVWNNQSYYVDMWGSLDDGSQFLLRSPVESMRESASISNRFLLYIGSVLIVVSILLIWYFSKRITDPIRELARLSDRMADLDFDAKYTSGGSNEIGELGENFNRMSEKLESTISELKKANNSLQKDIEQKDKLEKMRNEFLGNVSHELKTPIALIQGYAEGLKEGVNEDAESREFYCDVIMDEASKMNQMVKNLLTLNQLEFGDEDIVFERFNLTALVKGVLQSMEIMADQAGAKIMLHTEEDIYAWADEFKVEQVVRNYVSNALNHLDGDRRIWIRIEELGDTVKVTVGNNGEHIPEESLPNLWTKFYKVDKAHTREYGGNGIGLSIVKAIMKSFNQEYGVKNYDNGVEFWFELDVQ